MRILGAIVEPTTGLLAIGVADLFHRRGITAKPVGDDAPRSAIFLHGALEKLQRRGLVPLRRDDRFQDLAFMVDSAPKIAELAVDFHERLIQMPPPLAPRPASPCHMIKSIYGTPAGSASAACGPGRAATGIRSAVEKVDARREGAAGETRRPLFRQGRSAPGLLSRQAFEFFSSLKARQRVETACTVSLVDQRSSMRQ